MHANQERRRVGKPDKHFSSEVCRDDGSAEDPDLPEIGKIKPLRKSHHAKEFAAARAGQNIAVSAMDIIHTSAQTSTDPTVAMVTIAHLNII